MTSVPFGANYIMKSQYLEQIADTSEIEKGLPVIRVVNIIIW